MSCFAAWVCVPNQSDNCEEKRHAEMSRHFRMTALRLGQSQLARDKSNFQGGNTMKKVRTLVWIILLLLLCIPLMAPRTNYGAGKVAPPPVTNGQ